MSVNLSKIRELLGDEAETLLSHVSKTIPKESLHLPGGDFIDRVWINSDRTPAVLRGLQTLADHGRLSGTGYLSILPVDQGIEHSGGASFAPNPQYFDPENIVQLAIEGGCNAVASTFGALGSVARKYAHKIPFIVKINHNELMTYPNQFDQVMFGTVDQAKDMGAVAVGAPAGPAPGSGRTRRGDGRGTPAGRARCREPRADRGETRLPPRRGLTPRGAPPTPIMNYRS